MKIALLSVTDKRDLIPFARSLQAKGYTLMATGGTHITLKTAGLDSQALETLTGFAALFDGRVKSLHPKVHGGLLGLRENSTHQAQAKAEGIPWIDLIVVNLYAFEAAVKNPKLSDLERLEQIDIGGVALLRSAAKNHRHVTVISDTKDYTSVLEAMDDSGQLPDKMRRALAAKALRLTAYYDATIASYLDFEPFPEQLTLTYHKVQTLRYGENPHQAAALYRDTASEPLGLIGADVLHGKPLSYNNIQDAEAALAMVHEYEQPCVVAVKHMNPCGIACDANLLTAWQKAYQADPVSIFGGIVALNGTVDRSLAEAIQPLFLEVILAPNFTEDALAMLKQKKNRRLIQTKPVSKQQAVQTVSIQGGLLRQETDQVLYDDLQFVTKKAPDKALLEQLRFAFKAVKHVKSNAIVIAKEWQTLGIGAGQMNRIGAAHIALNQAGSAAKGAVLASDAFFPMPDTVEAAAKAGITAIIQPGGSVNDAASIEACNHYGIAMVFTQTRHFKH